MKWNIMILSGFFLALQAGCTSLSSTDDKMSVFSGVYDAFSKFEILDSVHAIDDGSDCTRRGPSPDDEPFACPAALDSIDFFVVDAGKYLLVATLEDPSSLGPTQVCAAFDYKNGGYDFDKAAEGTDLFVCTEISDGTVFAEEYRETGGFRRDAVLGSDLAYVSKNDETGAANLEPLVFAFEIPQELLSDAFALDGATLSIIAYDDGSPTGVDVLEIGELVLDTDTGDYRLEESLGE